ncbi:hypothetical protein AAHA92_14739 [Salvia divinorum]|uniref:Uncharacterized protein n=1 Tax=Salvia divinorum TaxID=28513 RepID=A0ABD1HCI4_SALDI
MRGNEGRTLTTVKMSKKENISQIVLRSGKAYDGPIMQTENGEFSSRGGMDGQLIKETDQVSDNINPRNEDLRGPLPQMDNPFFLDPEEGVENKGSSIKEKEEETKERAPSECYDHGVQQTKSFPHRGKTKKRRKIRWTSWKSSANLKLTYHFCRHLNFSHSIGSSKNLLQGRLKLMGRL